MTPFGDNVRRLRREKGWTQEQLAEKVDASQGLIWKIESGRGLPSLDNAFAIADALGVTVDELNREPAEVA